MSDINFFSETFSSAMLYSRTLFTKQIIVKVTIADENWHGLKQVPRTRAVLDSLNSLVTNQSDAGLWSSSNKTHEERGLFT